MIRIIKGVYGYVDSNGIPQPKTSKDEAFELDEDKEKELVEKGVAEYVNGPETKNEAKVDKKANTKKKADSNKKAVSKKKAEDDEIDEEPPTFEAVEPE